MTKIDEIALRVWSDVAKSSSVGQSVAIKFAHALLAELSKDAEPVMRMKVIGGKPAYAASILRIYPKAPVGEYDLFTHPAMPDQSEIDSLRKDADNVTNFVNQFSRFVGGDGEFWLHELHGFYGTWKRMNDAAMLESKS